MANIAELVVQLTAHTGRFKRGILDASSTLTKLTSVAALTRASVGSLSTALIGGVGAGAFAYFVKSQGDAVEKLGVASDTLGTTTENLAALKTGARKAGVDFETLTKGISNFEKMVAKANAGDKEMQRLFENFGLDPEQLGAMDSTDAIAAAADQINSLASAQDRLLAATLLFGKSGEPMLNFLKQGSEGIEEMKQRAAALGYEFDRVDAQQIAMANDAFSDLRTSIEAVGAKLAIAFAPMVQAVTDKVVALGNEGVPLADRFVQAVDWIIRAFARTDNLWIEMRLGIAEVELSLMNLIKRMQSVERMGATLLGGLIGGASTAASNQDKKILDEIEKEEKKLREYMKDIGQDLVDANDLTPFQEAFQKWKDEQRAAAEEAVANNNEVGVSLDGLLDKYEKMGNFSQGSFRDAASYATSLMRGTMLRPDNQPTGLSELGRQNKDPQISETNKILRSIEKNTEENYARAS